MKKNASRLLALLPVFFLSVSTLSAPRALFASDTTDLAAGNAAYTTDALASLNADDLLQMSKTSSLPVPAPRFFQAAPIAGDPVVITIPGLSSRILAGSFISSIGNPTPDPDSYLQDRLEQLPQSAAITILFRSSGPGHSATPRTPWTGSCRSS